MGSLSYIPMQQDSMVFVSYAMPHGFWSLKFCINLWQTNKIINKNSILFKLINRTWVVSILQTLTQCFISNKQMKIHMYLFSTGTNFIILDHQCLRVTCAYHHLISLVILLYIIAYHDPPIITSSHLHHILNTPT